VTSVAVAQVTRQESTNQLKKVVYSFNAQECPQVVMQADSQNCHHYAVVSIPEFTVENMPQHSASLFYGGFPGFPSGTWQNAFLFVIWADGVAYVHWKTSYSDGSESVVATQFKIVLTYETRIELAVANPGTGKSLDLKWQANKETAAKIRGYKVYRREKP
jgi:hypothetical protein